MKFQVLAIFKKFKYPGVFMFLMLYFMLDELILLRQSDYNVMTVVVIYLVFF